MALPHFVYLIASCWKLGLVDLGGWNNMNNTAMNVCVEVFVWAQKILCGVISFEYIPRSGIAGSYDKFMFSF